MSKTNERGIPTLSLEQGAVLLESLRSLGKIETLSEILERPKTIKLGSIKLPSGFDPDDALVVRGRLFDLAKTFPARVSEVEKARNAFDLAFARQIYELLQVFPKNVLMSRDFWRYLAIYEMFEIGAWRYPDSGKKTWGQNFGVSGSFSRCFPYKGFLRGKLISKIEELGLPWSDIDDVDFYDSHLFGRRNALIPGVASALNSVRKELSSSRALDPYATVIRQYRGTHLTELLSHDEVKEVMNRYVDRSKQRKK